MNLGEGSSRAAEAARRMLEAMLNPCFIFSMPRDFNLYPERFHAFIIVKIFTPALRYCYIGISGIVHVGIQF